MKRPQVVVFDIDDTLYLERDYVRSGFEAVGAWIEAKRSVPGFANVAWGLFEEGRRGTIFNEALAQQGIPSELVPELVNVYRRHRPSIHLLADSASCIEAVRGAGGRLAAITDGPRESQRAKVEALGLEDRIELVILTAELGEGFGKPHPRSFEQVQGTFRADPSACVYVADNPAKDFAGPKSLGWKTVRVRRPGGLHEHAASGPDVDVETAAILAVPAILGLA